MLKLHQNGFDKVDEAHGTGNIFNPLLPREHLSHNGAIYTDILKIEKAGAVPDITKASLTSRKVEFVLADGVHYDNLFLNILLGTTTTADYRDHLGVGMMEKILLLAGDQKFQIDNPRQWLVHALNKLTKPKRDYLLKKLGGVNIDSVSGQVRIMVWLPFFFDQLLKSTAPLDLNQVSAKVKVQIWFYQNTQILKATGTGGSIVEIELLAMVKASDLSISFEKYFTYEIQELTSIQTVATATETDIDINTATGTLKCLFIMCTLASDFLVDFYKFSKVSEIKDRVNSTDYLLFESNEEGEIENFIYSNGLDDDATIGYNYTVPYVSFHKNFESHHVGGLDGTNLKEHKIKITHTNGADCYIEVGGVIAVSYVHDAMGKELQKIN